MEDGAALLLQDAQIYPFFTVCFESEPMGTHGNGNLLCCLPVPVYAYPGRGLGLPVGLGPLRMRRPKCIRIPNSYAHCTSLQ